jgi:uncharacterized membrane protein YraQ (UPF0718 family)
MSKSKLKSILKAYKWAFILPFILVLIYLFNHEMGTTAAKATAKNFRSMLTVLPPILMLIGLLDVWVPRTTMIKYLGHGSGIKGILIALFLGSLSAGPLFAAFPVAAILLKKGARPAYVIFFLGAWSSSKLPILIYELASFGKMFTLIHVISNLILFLASSFLIEKLLSHSEIQQLAAVENS